jgi:hypothetical protein
MSLSARLKTMVAIGIGRRVEGGKALRQGKAVLIAVQPLHPLRYIAKAALKA